jgi:hypothetical protein
MHPSFWVKRPTYRQRCCTAHNSRCITIKPDHHQHPCRSACVEPPSIGQYSKLAQHERYDWRDLLAKKTPFETTLRDDRCAVSSGRTGVESPQGDPSRRLLRSLLRVNGGGKEGAFSMNHRGKRAVQAQPGCALPLSRGITPHLQRGRTRFFNNIMQGKERSRQCQNILAAPLRAVGTAAAASSHMLNHLSQ